MAWDANITGTTEIDETLVTLFADMVYLAAGPNLVLEQLVQVRDPINAKANTYSKYPLLTVQTSALTEDNDATSEAYSDTVVTVTPLEYGNVITRTLLSSLQTGGKLDVAAARAVGQNAGASQEYLAAAALTGLTPYATVYPNTVAAAAGLSNLDVMDRKFVNKIRNKLSRRGTPTAIGTNYILVVHPDNLSDLTQDVQLMEIAVPEAIKQGFVGMLDGFLIYASAATNIITANSAGTIDSYKTIGFGADVLIKNESQAPVVKISGPFDKLGRFLNLGWYGVFAYGALDGNNAVHGVCASSFGANAS
jgi:hypothetical protein